MKGLLSCLAAFTLLTAAAPSEAYAKGGVDGAGREKVLARLKKARAENRRVEVRFKNTVTLTGRVGEVRERGFTFEPEGEDDAAVLRQMDMVAAVLYEDVASVRYPSKVRKFFKGLRIGVVGVGAAFVVLPVYGVMALLGDLPSC